MCGWECEHVLHHTIHHKRKLVVFLREHKGNFAHCVERFLRICEPQACYLHFLRFFQDRLINVCRVRTETMVRIMFKENWFTVHLVQIVRKPHNVLKVCSVCPALYYVHTPASLHLSKACVIAQAVMRVTQVLLHAWLELFLHSSKACVVAQAGTQLMSTFV